MKGSSGNRRSSRAKHGRSGSQTGGCLTRTVAVIALLLAAVVTVCLIGV
jgi:hypothetical protein